MRYALLLFSFPLLGQQGYVTFSMKPTDSQQAALEKLLHEQQDPESPNYHRWLTPETFGDRFGLSEDDYAMVVAWVESQGLHIENRARARNWLAFSGSEPEVRSALRNFPEAVNKLVSGVRGLDSFSSPPAPRYTSTSGAHLLSPDDWASIYDVSPLYKMGIDGTGQRIAIIGRSDMNQSYIDSFRARFGLAPSTIEQHLIGPDPGITNAAGEAALDLEWSGAIARNATIVYVYANNFNDAAQAAIDQNLAPVMSQSYGVCELESGAGGRAMAQQANAQGITWMASAGDSGGAGCDPHGFFNSAAGLTPAALGLAVDLPAAYPEVTAVGGTQFNEGSGNYWSANNTPAGGSALSYIPEVVWNETGAGGILASGGGASVLFPKPVWQTGPGVPNDNARDVPDVSFSAAGNHDGYMVINANGNVVTGGTSAASPSFAGVVALLNQYVISSGLQSSPGLGNINPALYRLAQSTTGVFHDITQGNNMVPCASGSPDCSTGSLGFNAGPGYDQATGLGSIDVFNLITQWKSAAAGQPAATTTTLTVNPGSITLGDTAQLTATVTPAAATGTVTFSTGQTILGSAALVNVAGAALATLTVTGAVLPVGNPTVNASYGGDDIFNGSTGSTTATVNAAAPGSLVTISITPNPARGGQFVEVTLTEEAGVGTTITAWSINGVDNFYRFVTDFGSATLPPHGVLSASFTSAVLANYPSSRLYVFSGVDASGRQWTQQYNLTVGAPFGPPAVTLSSAPSGSSACPWQQQLMLQEQAGLPVQLTRLLAAGTDITSQMQQLFGTTRLAALGSLQASVCWPLTGPAPSTATFEVDGVDQSGSPVRATASASLSSSASSPGTVSLPSIALTSQSTSASLGLNPPGNASWSVSIFPANPSTRWLTVSPASGTGSQQLKVTAAAGGLSNGIYNATLLVSSPQLIEVPVTFAVGASSTMSIGGVANGATFQQAFAPGMILSVFGAQLAPSTQAASSLPLPFSMAGVSATINGVPAPLYYVSPGQLNMQIPYETGAGTAVLGVTNNGQVASYLFTVAAAAPGIFAVPIAGKAGDTVTFYLTGDGLVSTSLATGASPFSATPLALLPKPALPLTVSIGGIEAATAFVGIPSGLAGVTQVNFVIPAGIAPGVQPLVVTVGGLASPPASVTVSP